MTPVETLVATAEASIRRDTGIIWDMPLGMPNAFGVTDACTAASDPIGLDRRHLEATVPVRPAQRTDGAAYHFDGSLEGMLSAIGRAWSARDASADIISTPELQARLGQETVEVETRMDDALRMRRVIEYALGAQAFHCIRAASASEDPERGTAIYRFMRYALAASNRPGCYTCPKKSTCVKACSMPPSCPVLDDLGAPPVRKLMELHRGVMNERHRMVQFIRFERRGEDIWYARCHPNASVVPLLMDWFVARFNAQRFVIHDERHAISGVYDGRRWYLVGGDAVTPPPASLEESEMQRAWRLFYRCASIDSRYNPELRRNFMPMRLWRDLSELAPEPYPATPFDQIHADAV